MNQFIVFFSPVQYGFFSIPIVSTHSIHTNIRVALSPYNMKNMRKKLLLEYFFYFYFYKLQQKQD